MNTYQVLRRIAIVYLELKWWVKNVSNKCLWFSWYVLHKLGTIQLFKIVFYANYTEQKPYPLQTLPLPNPHRYRTQIVCVADNDWMKNYDMKIHQLPDRSFRASCSYYIMESKDSCFSLSQWLRALSFHFSLSEKGDCRQPEIGDSPDNRNCAN